MRTETFLGGVHSPISLTPGQVRCRAGTSPCSHGEKGDVCIYFELLNGKGNLAFFDLQTGGRKANNAQKEKRRLARKRSRASKRAKGNGKLRKRPNFPRASGNARHADASSSPARPPRSTSAPIPKWHVYQGKQPVWTGLTSHTHGEAGQARCPTHLTHPPLTHHKLGVNAQAGHTTIPCPQ